MNRSKDNYSVRYEPGSSCYSIYNNGVMVHTGYDSKLEADADLEELIQGEEPATAKDFEEFFASISREMQKIPDKGTPL